MSSNTDTDSGTQSVNRLLTTTQRKWVLVGVIALFVLGAGCLSMPDDSDASLSNDENSELQDVDSDIVGESYWYEVSITEENQQGLINARPPFVMEDSLERQNLIDRYEYLNGQNNVHHVYMLSHDGKVVNYEVAQGKVSSVNSQLTNNKQIVKAEDCSYRGAGHSSGDCFKTVESPQMDGSYGENGDAIFFFTTDGHYVEWNGIYVVSEEPKEITTEITLIEEVSDDEGDN